MDDVFVYLRDDLPIEVHEYVTPCLTGYTIYINAKLAQNKQVEAYEHALKHIGRGDFESIQDVQSIELEAHGIKVPVEVFEKKRRRHRKSARVKFLESIGYDFFAAAEERWLEP